MTVPLLGLIEVLQVAFLSCRYATFIGGRWEKEVPAGLPKRVHYPYFTVGACYYTSDVPTI